MPLPTKPPIDPSPVGLPKRNAAELAEALRVRAGCLDRQHWETPATVAMMREAADLLASASSRVRDAEAERDTYAGELGFTRNDLGNAVARAEAADSRLSDLTRRYEALEQENAARLRVIANLWKQRERVVDGTTAASDGLGGALRDPADSETSQNLAQAIDTGVRGASEHLVTDSRPVSPASSSGAANLPNVPRLGMDTETVTYACGWAATGVAPLPRHCPNVDQCLRAEKAEEQLAEVTRQLTEARIKATEGLEVCARHEGAAAIVESACVACDLEQLTKAQASAQKMTEAIGDYAEDLRSRTWLAPVSAKEMNDRDRGLADELDKIADGALSSSSACATVTKSCGNVFSDLGFPPEEAEALLIEADAKIAACEHPAASRPTGSPRSHPKGSAQ